MLEQRAAGDAAGSAPPLPRAPLRRLPQRGVIGGVCAALAARLGVDVTLVRVLTVVLAAFGGLGVALYVLAWALLPEASPLPDLAASRRARRLAVREAVGVALLVLAGLLALRGLGLWLGDVLVWPLVLASSGLALIWRQRDTAAAWTPAELRHPLHALRARLRGGRGADGQRTVVGVALVALAAYVLLRATGTLAALGNAIGGLAVLLAALALVLGPWIARLARSLAAERAERIRSQERAELAAHLHDSVLQTLTLIQHRAGEPSEVAGLARRQERELRVWLAGRAAQPPGGTLATALEQAAAEIERLHAARIDVVAVGDCPLDERLGALVGAAREALANAARFAGEQRIDLYAEVAQDRVEVFVRDRGAGFDLAAVPADRRGVRESIHGRMARHGGRAMIRSAPGAGTEVELSLERERA